MEWEWTEPDAPAVCQGRLAPADISINDLEEKIPSPLIESAADTKIRAVAGEEEERATIPEAS